MTKQKTGNFSSIFGDSFSASEMTISHQSIAEKLIKDGFILTALELHTELLESGKELKYLKDYFENSKNFSCSEDVVSNLQSPETPSKGGRRSNPGTPSIHRTVSRSGSQMTLDSIDQLTRYSEDTDRKDDERVAILEYELRTARETINQLKSELSDLTKSEKGTEDVDEDVDNDEEDEQAKPHEKKALNYVVNDYLIMHGYKFTAITFSDECDGQNLEDWDEEGCIGQKPSSLLKLWRGSGTQTTLSNNLCESEAQTEDFEFEAYKDRVNSLTLENENLSTALKDIQLEVKNLEKQIEEAKTERELDVFNHSQMVKNLEEEKQKLMDDMKQISKSPAKHIEDVRNPAVEREEGDGASLIDEPITTSSSPSVERESFKYYPKTQEQFLESNLSNIPRVMTNEFQLKLITRSFPVNIAQSFEFNSQNEDIVQLLSELLPKIIPNLVLSSRTDIVPVIMTCINENTNKKTRENLFASLFNLMKRPDDSMRPAILSGLFWLVHQNKWDGVKIEEELIPHILEQINLKYYEKKLLVGEIIAVIANHVSSSIRSSLLVSLCLQLLEDNHPEVIGVGVRTLSLLVNMVEDHEKLEKLLKVAVKLWVREDISCKDREEIEISLLSTLSVWLLESDRILTFLMKQLKEMEELPMSINVQDDTIQVEKTIFGNETILKNLSIIFFQVPYLCYNLIKNCPGCESKSNENVPDIFIKTFGKESQQQYQNFLQYTSQEWYKPWSNMDDFFCFFQKLLLFFSTVPIQNVAIIEQCSKVLSKIIHLLGCEFSQKELFKIIVKTQNVNKAIVFNAFISQEMELFAVGLLKDWIQNEEVSDMLLPSIKSFLEERNKKILMENLFELLRHSKVTVRVFVGKTVSFLVTEDVSASDIVPKLIIPALLNLLSDEEDSVKVEAVRGLFKLLDLHHLDYQEKERLQIEIQNLMETGNEKVCIEITHQLSKLMIEISDQDEEETQSLIILLCQSTKTILKFQSLNEDALLDLITAFSSLLKINHTGNLFPKFNF